MSTEDPGGGPVLPSSDENGRGFLTVGHDDRGEVVINFPPIIRTDQNGFFFIAFSPDQARHLATLLNKRAAMAEAETAKKPRERK